MAANFPRGGYCHVLTKAGLSTRGIRTARFSFVDRILSTEAKDSGAAVWRWEHWTEISNEDIFSMWRPVDVSGGSPLCG
jgi:hypothetical protein